MKIYQLHLKLWTHIFTNLACHHVDAAHVSHQTVYKFPQPMWESRPSYMLQVLKY